MRSFQNRIGLCVGATATLLLAGASVSRAAYPFDTMTFDTASTITTSANYNPPPVGARFDFGDGNPSLAGNSSTAWAGSVDHTGNDGGSIALTSAYVDSETGNDEKAGFTLDLAPSAVNAASISFYLMLDPSSPVDENTGAGASSGYAQIGIRDNSYNFASANNISVNGSNQGSGWNLGDPTYSGTSDKGTWEYISIPLDNTDNMVRAITIQNYDENANVANGGSGRVLNGTLTMYIDDLTIAPTPEPAALALLGLALPGMMIRRRR
jgi:hypothetical protein